MSDLMGIEMDRISDIKKKFKESGVKTITPRNMFEQYLVMPEEYSSIDDVLKKEWIIRMTKCGVFHQFSVSRKHLIIEFDGGKRWIVAGFLSHDESENIPKWIPPEK